MSHIKIRITLCLFFLLSHGIISAQSVDTVLINGKVLTVDADNHIAEAISISGERIHNIGTTDEIRALADTSTRVIDLQGRTVIPGLIDNHTHAIRQGLSYGSEVDWYETKSLKEGLALVREAAERLPPDAWIIVTNGWHGGWHPRQFRENRLPTPAELNEAAQGRPAYIRPAEDMAILSITALDALGITKDADIRNGRVELDEKGNPTGRIFGKDGWTFVDISQKIPKQKRNIDQQIAGTKTFFKLLNRYGMTSIVDPGGMTMVPSRYQALFRIWQGGQLSLRIAYHTGNQLPGDELTNYKTVAALLPQGFGDNMLKFNGFGEGITRGTTDGPRTLPQFEPKTEDMDRLRAALTWMAENGYIAKIHCSSDATARQFLDVIEEINQLHSVDKLRWSFEHLNNPSDSTITRMKNLGMIHGVQNLLYYAGEEYQHTFGDNAAKQTTPMRTELDAGLIITGGSDYPEAPYNPWVSIRWFLDGVTVKGTSLRDPGLNPTRAEVLRIFTYNGAYMSFDENEKGSLEVGKLADLAVLNEDYMTIETDQISEIESLLTMVGGKIIYSALPY